MRATGETTAVGSHLPTAAPPLAAFASSAGPVPFFLGQVGFFLGIDIAGTFPPQAQLSHPPPQRIWTQPAAVAAAEMRREQRNRPGGGLVAQPQGVTAKLLLNPRGSDARRHRRAARPGLVKEGFGGMLLQIAVDPIVDGLITDAYDLCYVL